MADDHVYLDDPRNDDLARMVTELTSELWILRDRVMVLEHLLDERGVLPRADLDDHEPDGAFADRLASEREALVARVLGAPHGDGYTVESLVAKGHR